MQDTISIPDRDLLSAYTRSGSESAFAELVTRHTNLVYSAALRQVRLEHLAEDVTQSVFILLARKAAQIRPEVILSGWLLRSTHYIAMDLIKSEFRRTMREQSAVHESLSSVESEIAAHWDEVAAQLDSILALMPEEDRDALALRYFENKSLEQVGQALGVSEDAAKKRVSRALDRLRVLLGKRKVTLSALALAAGLSARAVQAAPHGLAEAALESAMRVGATGGKTLLSGSMRKTSGWGRVLVGASCMVLVSALTWQGARWYSMRNEQSRLASILASLMVTQTGLEKDRIALEKQIQSASNLLATIRTPSTVVALTNTNPRQFQWNPTNEYVCIPKQLLNYVAFDGTNTHNDVAQSTDEERVINKKTGQVSDTLCQVLGLTPEEQAAVQDLFETTLAEYRKMCESKGYLTNAMSLDFSKQDYFKPNAEAVAWVTPALVEEGNAWRNYLRESLEELIGVERAQFLLRQAACDNSISRCFNEFGAQQVIVAISPMTYSRCYVCRQKTRNGEMISGVGFSAPIGQILDPQNPKWGAPGWTVLDDPMPNALIPILKQWEADSVNQTTEDKNQ